ncbi:dynamin family protein [Photobacterium leiognathi]|uniref:dynamin family protein n=1 Tax=Photobacterium leiognathi TaxID=553611 RepID=UPI0029827AD5|nr:dynamin family protein [Photobacterium leiognathi]
MDKEKLNQEMSGYLNRLREKSGLTQHDIAARSNVFGIGRVLDQRSVSRTERSPITAESTKLAAYLIAVGSTPDAYFDALKACVIKHGPIIGSFFESKSKMELSQLLVSSQQKLNEVSNILEMGMTGVGSESILDAISQSHTSLKCLERKPVIGVFGIFDAGKSTLLNTIVGQLALTEAYTPATSVVNLLIHIDDRPSCIKSNVAVFKKGFQPFMVHDPKLVNEYILAEGDASILDRFGVHNYDEEDPIAKEAYISISFLDSDILKTIWLLDTPGDLNSSDDADTEKALTGAELVDGVIYVSSFNGFMSGNDLAFLSNVVRNKPPVSANKPLDHIMFALSHCHDGITPAELDQIKNKTFKRCSKQLNNLIFDSWLEDGEISSLPTNIDLVSRIRPFYRENAEYVRDVISLIREMASNLEDSQGDIVQQRVDQIEKRITELLESEVNKINSFKESTEKRIYEVEEMDAQFRIQSSKLVTKLDNIKKDCSNRAADDKQVITNYYNSLMTVENLTEIINDIYEDKKDASEGSASYLSQLLTTKVERVLTQSGKSYSNEIELILKEWQSIMPSHARIVKTDIGPSTECDFDLSSFNARAAFIGGLSSIGSLGAMSMYVSTIASNLGAYILVGKAAGVLVSLGLASSVSSVTAFVAAIGGPVTLGITIAASIGYVVYRIAGGSWQKANAKKCISEFEKNYVLNKMLKMVDDFWNSTQSAMASCMSELELESNTFIENMKKEAKIDFNIKDLDNSIASIEESKLIIGCK